MKPNLCFILDKITTVFINSRNIENFIENLHFKENSRVFSLYFQSEEKGIGGVCMITKMTDTDLEDMKVFILFRLVFHIYLLELTGNISLNGF